MSFDPWKMLTALDMGGRREIKARLKGRVEPHGSPKKVKSWGYNIESAGAEYLVSLETGQRWNCEIGIDMHPKPADVGERIEVRWTEHTNGHLPIYYDDPIDRLYYMVVGHMPNLEIVGCINGEQGMRDEYRTVTPRDGVECFWVPRSVVEST